jgi:hypothetical protein
MARLNREEGHLVIAAIRVLAHRHGRPPAPAEIAELLDLPEATVRLQLAALHDLGAVAMIESAFATHAEIRTHQLVDELPPADERELSSDLAEFDRRKQEEAERMARLFSDGEHEKRRSERFGKMDRDLADFRKRKPRNPFDEE